MQLTSLWFFSFLFLVVIATLADRGRNRNLLAVCFSIVFLFFFRYVDIAAVLLTYANVIFFSHPGRGRMGLISGIALQLAIMIFFKYVSIPGALMQPLFPVLPGGLRETAGAVGLSFYSLQAIAYMTEVHRNEVSLQPRQNVFLYLFFFPKIYQGPVELPGPFIKETKSLTPGSYDMAAGGRLILLGFVKKLAVADVIAPYANAAFDVQESPGGLVFVLGAYLFTLQLYFDFSGYTDMALGAARLLGFRLTENFRYPLFSSSITELWRRWHISLVRWLTEYIYTPVVFHLRKYRTAGVLAAIVITFLLSGLWHGAGLTFIAWGLLNALCVCAELIAKQPREKLQRYRAGRYFSILLTFQLFCLINIFFRAETLDQAGTMLAGIVSPESYSTAPLNILAHLTGGGEWEKAFNFILAVMLSLSLLFTEPFIRGRIEGNRSHVFITLVLALLLCMFGRMNGAEHFIYKHF